MSPSFGSFPVNQPESKAPIVVSAGHRGGIQAKYVAVFAAEADKHLRQDKCIALQKRTEYTDYNDDAD